MGEPEVEEWLDKAEQDYKVAMRSSAEETPDPIVYHCQQCAEKYPKAALVQRGHSPPFTHDLGALMGLLEKAGESCSALMEDVETLDAYGVAPRYPGNRATPHEVAQAREAARRVRGELRSRLGLAIGVPEEEPDSQ